MNIHGVSHVHGPHGVNAPHSPRPSRAALPEQQPTVDQLDISPAASAAADIGEVREDLVNRVKSQIANGTYDTPQKLDAALDRLLDELG